MCALVCVCACVRFMLRLLHEMQFYVKRKNSHVIKDKFLYKMHKYLFLFHFPLIFFFSFNKTSHEFFFLSFLGFLIRKINKKRRNGTEREKQFKKKGNAIKKNFACKLFICANPVTCIFTPDTFMTTVKIKIQMYSFTHTRIRTKQKNSKGRKRRWIK